MVASVITKSTALPIPMEVDILLETPTNGQIPRNCANTILLTKMAEDSVLSTIQITLKIKQNGSPSSVGQSHLGNKKNGTLYLDQIKTPGGYKPGR